MNPHWPNTDIDPRWRSILDQLHHKLSLMNAMKIVLPEEVRLFLPLSLPPSRPGRERHGTTVFGVSVTYTAAVSTPILGIALDLPLPEAEPPPTVE